MRVRVLALCVVVGPACSGAAPSGGSTHEPSGDAVVHHAVVVQAVGSAPANEGDDCAVEVTPVRGAYFNCRIRVSCRNEVLYGLPGAGYNTCRLEEGAVRTAEDRNGTRRDGDPRMFLDLQEGRVVVSDRDPDMELVLAVESGAPPVGTAASPPPGYGPDHGDHR